MTNFTEKDLTRLCTRMLLDEPFYGTLAMYMKWVLDPSEPTVCTNGVVTTINPTFFATELKSDGERLFVAAHVVIHAALGHIYRRESRNLELWNDAADYVTNSILVESGTGSMPKGAFYDVQYNGMGVEAVYAKLLCNQQQKQGSGSSLSNGGQQLQTGAGNNGQRQNKACPTGRFTDGPTDTGGDDSVPDGGMSEDLEYVTVMP